HASHRHPREQKRREHGRPQFHLSVARHSRVEPLRYRLQALRCQTLILQGTHKRCEAGVLEQALRLTVAHESSLPSGLTVLTNTLRASCRRRHTVPTGMSRISATSWPLTPSSSYNTNT